jgi:hypothetical protein
MMLVGNEKRPFYKTVTDSVTDFLDMKVISK